MNYLLPLRKNYFLPKETKMASPLGNKVAALEADMGRLEKQLADVEKKTVRAALTERANDPARWEDGDLDADASTLAATPPGAEDEPDPEKKFDAMVENIARRDGVTKAAAAARARREYPNLFADYQRANVSKGYDELIADEIRKGFSPVVSAQRVAYAYPQATRESLAKSASVSDFMSAVDEIKKVRGVSRTEAMRLARHTHPQAFARFENVV